jgi:hypothetical protein
MNLLLAWWHEMRADADDFELLQRSYDGSASDVWACRVKWIINWRRQEAVLLRRASLTLRVWSAVVGAVRSYRRAA